MAGYCILERRFFVSYPLPVPSARSPLVLAGTAFFAPSRPTHNIRAVNKIVIWKLSLFAPLNKTIGEINILIAVKFLIILLSTFNIYSILANYSKINSAFLLELFIYGVSSSFMKLASELSFCEGTRKEMFFVRSKIPRNCFRPSLTWCFR